MDTGRSRTTTAPGSIGRVARSCRSRSRLSSKSDKNGRTMLKKFHRVLIASGIVLGLLMVIFALVRYLANGDASYVPTGVIGVVSALSLSLYLRWFVAKQRSAGGSAGEQVRRD